MNLTDLYNAALTYEREHGLTDEPRISTPILKELGTKLTEVTNALEDSQNKLAAVEQGIQNACDEGQALSCKLAEVEKERHAAQKRGEELERHIDKVGFYFAGTEHQHIADKAIEILKGNPEVEG